MQLIFNGLHNRGVELSEMIHHAVLPSFDLADNFRFKSGENLEPSTRILCNAMAPSANQKRGSIDATLHCEGEEDVDIVSKPSFLWTTVSIWS